MEFDGDNQQQDNGEQYVSKANNVEMKQENSKTSKGSQKFDFEPNDQKIDELDNESSKTDEIVKLDASEVKSIKENMEF